MSNVQKTLQAMGPSVVQGLWYLGSPYSHPLPAMRERRFHAAARVAGLLYREYKVQTFCPIAHSHPIEQELIHLEMLLPGQQASDLMMPWDAAFFPITVGMIVCGLPGWAISVGMTNEESEFRAAGKPVAHLDPSEWFSAGEWRALTGEFDD